MRTQWRFVPLKSSGPIGYKWRWIKAINGKIIEESAGSFHYYYECLVDAQEHGYHAGEPKIAPLVIV